MKQLLLPVFFTVSTLSVLAQTQKTPVKQPAKQPAAKPALPVKPLKTLEDSASYAVGLSRASFFKQQGITKLNTSLVSQGCREVFKDEPTSLDPNGINSVLTRFASVVNANNAKATNAQPGKPATKPALPAKLVDSASYAIGLDIAGFYKQHGIDKLDPALITQAFNDVFSNKPTLLNESVTNDILNRYIVQAQLEMVKPTIDAGNAFLEENKKRPEVKTTASGLQYEVLTEGTGARPTAADSVTCHYKGTFIDGTEFDASYKHGGPITFNLGGVIRGWTEGLQLMTEGSKYKFYIPYSLAYGPFDRPGIPGGSMLIFEVELLSVKKN